MNSGKKWETGIFCGKAANGSRFRQESNHLNNLFIRIMKNPKIIRSLRKINTPSGQLSFDNIPFTWQRFAILEQFFGFCVSYCVVYPLKLISHPTPHVFRVSFITLFNFDGHGYTYHASCHNIQVYIFVYTNRCGSTCSSCAGPPTFSSYIHASTDSSAHGIYR